MVGGGVNDECPNVESVIIVRSEKRLVKPMSGVDRWGDIDRTCIDDQLMVLYEFQEIGHTRAKDVSVRLTRSDSGSDILKTLLGTPVYREHSRVVRKDRFWISTRNVASDSWPAQRRPPPTDRNTHPLGGRAECNW